MCLRVPEGSTWRLPSDQGGRHRKRVIKCTPIYGVCHALDKIRSYSPSAKKDEGRNSTLSEVIFICTCGMYLRVPEGSIWHLPSDQVGGV